MRRRKRYAVKKNSAANFRSLPRSNAKWSPIRSVMGYRHRVLMPRVPAVGAGELQLAFRGVWASARHGCALSRGRGWLKLEQAWF